MVKKYGICPDYVTSKNDGQRYFITAGRLMELYGVNPAECIVFRSEADFRGRDLRELTLLYPDYSGEYKLPIDPKLEFAKNDLCLVMAEMVQDANLSSASVRQKLAQDKRFPYEDRVAWVVQAYKDRVKAAQFARVAAKYRRRLVPNKPRPIRRK